MVAFLVHIPVDHTVAMSDLKGSADFPNQPRSGLGTPRTPPKGLSQRPAPQQPHHQPRPVGVVAKRVQRHDMGMLQTSHHSSLDLEPIGESSTRSDRQVDHLDRHLTIQLGLIRPKHHPKTAHPQTLPKHEIATSHHRRPNKRSHAPLQPQASADPPP